MKILLCGACGKMGRELCELAGDAVVCGVDRDPAPAFFPVYSSFAEVEAETDVVIDFSSCEGVDERLRYCRDNGKPIVLGATGWSSADEALISSYARSIAIFKTGNLSIGVNLLQRLAREAAQALADFDAEIIERHHNQKKDAPSGTALMLAESVNKGFGGGMRTVCGREGIVGPRGKKEIGIHAVRGGTTVGEHEVSFYGDDETLTLIHKATSRKVFAAGALRAAAWLLGRPAGLYSMDDLLSEKFF